MFIKLMNRNNNLNGFAMNENSEGGAGSGSDNANQGSADNSNKASGSDELATLKAELESLKRNRDEILAEKKKVKDELNNIKTLSAEEKRKKAEAEKDFEKLYSFELEAKKELMSKLEMIEKAQNEEREKVVKTQMWSAFKKELGSELADESLAEKVVDWQKFVVDEQSKYGFNEQGLKIAVDEFRSKYSFMLKQDTKSVPQNAAKSTADDVSKLSFAERAKKAGLMGI